MCLHGFLFHLAAGGSPVLKFEFTWVPISPGRRWVASFKVCVYLGSYFTWPPVGREFLVVFSHTLSGYNFNVRHCNCYFLMHCECVAMRDSLCCVRAAIFGGCFNLCSYAG